MDLEKGVPTAESGNCCAIPGRKRCGTYRMVPFRNKRIADFVASHLCRSRKARARCEMLDFTVSVSCAVVQKNGGYQNIGS